MRTMALLLTAACLLGCPQKEDTGGGGGPTRLARSSHPDPDHYHAMVARAAASTSMLADALERQNKVGAARALAAARSNLYEAERYAGPEDQGPLIDAENQGVKVQASLSNGGTALPAAQELLRQLGAIQESYKGPVALPTPKPTEAQAPRPVVREPAPVPQPAPRHLAAPQAPPKQAPRPQATPRWSGMVPQPQFDPPNAP